METRLQRRRRLSKTVIGTNKAARPPPSDEMGGSGGGWEEEGRGRKGSGLQSRARARGHTNAYRWYAEDGGVQIASECLGAQHRDNWFY